MNKRFSTATELLQYLENEKNFELKAPINIDQITLHLGIKVEEDYSLEQRGIVGQIFIKEGNPTITINPLKNSYNPRRRFTLAHEIGHFCLHNSDLITGFTDSIKSMSRSESYWDSKEFQANNFAAQLLMPKKLIIQEGQKYIDTKNNNIEINPELFIDAMADIFWVSNPAMEYRLRNIGIIKD